MAGARKPASGKGSYTRLNHEQVKVLLSFKPEVAEALKELDLRVTSTGQLVKKRAPYGARCLAPALVRAPYGARCKTLVEAVLLPAAKKPKKAARKKTTRSR